MNYESGYLAVDALHRIYYEVHGNETGEPILFVHGGPGIGTSPNDLQFFDLTKVCVILFDQRGCGRSTPRRELKDNTSAGLVADMRQLLLHLGLSRVFLFGGSWGSTLSLLFAIQYPELVKGMILRGVFTATKAEREYFERGGPRVAHPQAWERYLAPVPEAQRSEASDYYYQKILFGEPAEREVLAHAMCAYGIAVGGEEKTEVEINAMLATRDYLTRAIILSHYSWHDFFIPDCFIENHLEALAAIPVHIIHGRHDHITRPQYAERLAAGLKRGTLYLVDAGHLAHEAALKSQLIHSVNEMIG